MAADVKILKFRNNNNNNNNNNTFILMKEVLQSHMLSIGYFHHKSQPETGTQLSTYEGWKGESTL